MAKNLLHCETGFGVYRSTQLGHILFLLLYLLVGPSIVLAPRPIIPQTIAAHSSKFLRHLTRAVPRFVSSETPL
jgi:hypothetical protein